MSDGYGWSLYLEKGDEVQWQGRPDWRLLILRPVDVLSTPSSLVWVNFARVAVRATLQTVGFLSALTNKSVFIATQAFGHSVSRDAIAPGTAIAVADQVQGRMTFGAAVRIVSQMQWPGLASWGVGDASFAYGVLKDAAQVYDTTLALKNGTSG